MYYEQKYCIDIHTIKDLRHLQIALRHEIFKYIWYILCNYPVNVIFWESLPHDTLSVILLYYVKEWWSKRCQGTYPTNGSVHRLIGQFPSYLVVENERIMIIRALHYNEASFYYPNLYWIIRQEYILHQLLSLSIWSEHDYT